MDSSLGISFEDTGSQSCIYADITQKCAQVKNPLKEHRSTSYKVKKVRNFGKIYLKLGLWPDRAPSALRQASYKAQSKIAFLKSRNEKENPCEKCKNHKTQMQSTKLALQHALDLSTLLIKQISINAS